MGNSAWGHGYHKGFSDGAVRGGAIVGGVLVVVDLAVRAAPVVYRKLKAQSFARREQEREDEAAQVTRGEGAVDGSAG